jgi:hypothetical protein
MISTFGRVRIAKILDPEIALTKKLINVMHQFMWKYVYLTCLLTIGCSKHVTRDTPHKMNTRLGAHFESLRMQYRGEDSFKGIIEAFKRSESKGGRIFLRSDPQCREGIYFIVVMNGTLQRIPEGSKIVLHFITDLTPHEAVCTWTVPNLRGCLRNELYLGITDDKKYTSKTQLVCWKIFLYGPENQLMSELESFAWEMPQ